MRRAHAWGLVALAVGSIALTGCENLLRGSASSPARRVSVRSAVLGVRLPAIVAG